ncbi:hypothetical protein A33I_00550 [Alkalihalophilus marmarensis DSM 21297]|uniref:Uncharacterized protein n=1 Tax=Alkalihalophilus marmarensis DSM 21297 TaxID=1188261 RepID=U6SLT6_9BACI|nr:hypothetical protein A33I_00550 [Alkalihalophilus marmarensis DSM 21297]
MSKQISFHEGKAGKPVFFFILIENEYQLLGK